MIFNSFAYFVLLSLTLGLYFCLPYVYRLVLLIGASLIFYAYWNVPLVSLIIISAVVDFSAGLMIGQTESRARRRAFLLLSLTVNLGLLGFFKYANFFIDNVQALTGGATDRRLVSILLPPGISFYTFQTMSYTIDVYRGKIQPTKSFLRFFLYVCFFPQLIAGPIERASHLLTQFDRAATQSFSMPNFVSGMRLIIWGLFKKVMIADTCGLMVDRVYADPGAFNGWSSLIATYGFTLQIYCDFSAYSEIARGSARLFGIDLVRNFDQPYLAGDVSTFWRRWHISLSNWIRDYIYIPLGGSQRGRPRMLINLVITMFLAGLWHGAAWNFVLWGLFHGLLLLIHASLTSLPPYVWLREKGGTAWKIGAWAITLHLVVLGWVLFRVEAIGDVAVILSGVWLSISSLSAPTGGQFQFLLFMAVFLIASYVVRRFAIFDLIHRDTGLSVVFYGTMIIIMTFFAGPGGMPFIYFQF